MTGEAQRRRRCVALQLAIVFGVLLPIAYWSRATFFIALDGVALAAFTYWRNCRGKGAADTSRRGT